MVELELVGLVEIADWLDQREMYIGAHMIKRDKDEAEGSAPNTYLGLQVAAPEVGGRFGVKPMVTGSGPVPPALPSGGPWAGDQVPMEEPLGFSIEELPALGGASEPLHSSVEIAAPAQVSGETSGE